MHSRAGFQAVYLPPSLWTPSLMTFYGVSGGCWQRRRRKKSIECKGPLHGNLGWQNKRGKGYMVLGATWDRFHGIEPIGLRGHWTEDWNCNGQPAVVCCIVTLADRLATNKQTNKQTHKKPEEWKWK